MPLPPAPTQRASRLTSKIFEQADSSAEEVSATTAKTPAHTAEKSTSKSRSRKVTALTNVAASTPSPSVAPTAPAPATKSASKKRQSGPRKLFVLDTNVLMHDPMSLFRFEEHDVFLPMIVLEELDGHKKGMTEVARNARQTSRSLDALAAAQGFDMAQGLPLNTTGYADALGKLFFQTQPLDLSLPLALPPGKADNQILGVVRALEQTHKPREVVLVSKDINMRVKARALGLQALHRIGHPPADLPAFVVVQFAVRQRRARGHDHERLHDQSAIRVGSADHGCLGNRRVQHESVLDLGSGDVVAAGHDHVV